jgi:hypothetical protein
VRLCIATLRTNCTELCGAEGAKSLLAHRTTVVLLEQKWDAFARSHFNWEARLGPLPLPLFPLELSLARHANDARTHVCTCTRLTRAATPRARVSVAEADGTERDATEEATERKEEGYRASPGGCALFAPWVRVQVFAYAALLAVFSLSISLDAVNRQAGTAAASADGPPDLGLVNGTTAAACAPLPNATLSDALAAAASCAHADWAASACAGLAAGGWLGADACAWAASHVGAALQPAVEVRCARKRGPLRAHTRSLPPSVLPRSRRAWRACDVPCAYIEGRASAGSRVAVVGMGAGAAGDPLGLARVGRVGRAGHTRLHVHEARLAAPAVSALPLVRLELVCPRVP